MAFSFANVFGGARGGISHGGAGQVQALPTAEPVAQLTTGNAAGTNGGNPVGNQQQQDQNKGPTEGTTDYQLAQMAKLWQTPTDAEGKPLAPQADPLNQQLFNFKPEDIQAAASKLDFTSGVNPELAGKALGGDAAALMELINSVTQKAFVASTLNTGNLLNDGFGRHSKNIDAALPTRLRNHAVATTVSDDPILSHEAVQPMIAGLKQMLAIKNPSMSAADIQKQAEDYVKGLGTALSSTKKEEQQHVEAKKETDWLAYSGIGS